MCRGCCCALGQANSDFYGDSFEEYADEDDAEHGFVRIESDSTGAVALTAGDGGSTEDVQLGERSCDNMGRTSLEVEQGSRISRQLRQDQRGETGTPEEDDSLKRDLQREKQEGRLPREPEDQENTREQCPPREKAEEQNHEMRKVRDEQREDESEVLLDRNFAGKKHGVSSLERVSTTPLAEAADLLPCDASRVTPPEQIVQRKTQRSPGGEPRQDHQSNGGGDGLGQGDVPVRSAYSFWYGGKGGVHVNDNFHCHGVSVCTVGVWWVRKGRLKVPLTLFKRCSSASKRTRRFEKTLTNSCPEILSVARRREAGEGHTCGACSLCMLAVILSVEAIGKEAIRSARAAF